MTSSLIIALVFSIGSSVWVYTKFQRQAGYGNAKNALIGAGAAFALIFVVVFSLCSMFIHKS
jgi:hypothetical protein